MIDYYDVLGVGLDAGTDEIKRAFKRKSLEHHPDKVRGEAADAAERFNEVKIARDVLEDTERRKIYDTFGTDLGEERPEMEVWTIGLTTMVSPFGGFMLKTIVAQLILWIIAFKWINRLLIFLGCGIAGLYYLDVGFGEFKIRSDDAVPILLNVGIIDAVVILYWIWPLLSETVGVFYLVTEVFGLEMLVADVKIGVAAGVGSLVFAWLSRGWWFWIFCAEGAIGFIMLAALTVASGIMRLWIDSVQAQRGDKLKAWRLAIRKERHKLVDENNELKKRLEQAKG